MEKHVATEKQLYMKDNVKVGSYNELEYLNTLDRDLAKADSDFINYTAKSLKVDANLEKQSDRINQMYYRMLMDHCFGSLSNGVNKESIVTSLCTILGAGMADKDFRGNIHRGFSNIIYPMVSKKAEKHGPESKWARKQESIIAENNGGRLPFTPRSAAITQIAFSRSYFNDIRKPNADIDSLTEKYKLALNTLYEDAAKDGVSYDSIVKCQHVVLGQLIEQDPTLAQGYEQMAYGDVKRSDYKSDGKGSVIWKGEFENKDGTPYTEMFMPRSIKSLAEHASKFNEFTTDTMSKYHSVSEVDKVLRSSEISKARGMRIDMMVVDGSSLYDSEKLVTDIYKSNWANWMQCNPDATVEHANAMAGMNSTAVVPKKHQTAPKNNRTTPWDGMFEEDPDVVSINPEDYSVS